MDEDDGDDVEEGDSDDSSDSDAETKPVPKGKGFTPRKVRELLA